MTSEKDVSEILKASLNMWWLRPENALAVAYYATYGADLRPRPGAAAVDYACGDGINTFFKCGGRFAPEFDLFKSGILEQDARTVATERLDVFDHYDQDYSPAVIERPETRYFCGTDHKQNLLKKAAKLDFYERLIEADLEQDTDIAQGSIDLVYCNSLYWVANTEKALGYMREKLKHDGTMVLDVFTTEKYTLDYAKRFPAYGAKWHELFNRGRMETNPGLRSPQGWEQLFDSAGLEIVSTFNLLPSVLMEIWNLGLRPIFPLLQKMASSITEQNRLEIKQEWVELFHEICLPILTTAQDLSDDSKLYRLQYRLKKKHT